MRKRSAEVLERVLVNRIPLSVQELAEEYGTSEKTLRNDVKEINQFLDDISQPELIISKEGRLIKARTFNNKETEKHLYSLDAYRYKFSGSERQNYIALVLLESGRYLTMQNFADELLVSRVTVMHDMEQVKEKLESGGVELILDPGKGMVIHCDEKTRLGMMADLIYEIREDRFIKNLVYQRLDVRYTSDDILTASQNYMKENKLLFVGDTYIKIAVYMFVLFNFASRKGSKPDSSVKVEGIDELMLTAAESLNVMVTRETLKLFHDFVSEGKDTVYLKSVNDLILYNAILQFLAKIDETLKLGISQDSMLADALLLHIRNMQNWEKYDVELTIDESEAVNYPLLWELTGEHAKILEKYLGHQLNDSIRKSIIIHICVAIIRSQKYMTPASILLVCPGSRAEGKYMEAQLQSYFNFRICNVLTEDRDIRRIDEQTEDIDFVLSTIPLKTELFTVYQIHQHLALEDLNLLQRVIFRWQYSMPYENNRKEAALRRFILRTFENKELAERLIEETRIIISDYTEAQNKTKSSLLSDRLNKTNIVFGEGSPEWRDAIRLSAEPLLRAGAIDSTYVENSIQVVEEYGDYIVVSEGVAMPHANPELGGVHRDSLSLLVCPEGVHFTESDSMVYLLFFFASTGKKDDLDVLKAIIRIGHIPGEAKRIASLKDIDAIYETILSGSGLPKTRN